MRSLGKHSFLFEFEFCRYPKFRVRVLSLSKISSSSSIVLVPTFPKFRVLVSSSSPRPSKSRVLVPVVLVLVLVLELRTKNYQLELYNIGLMNKIFISCVVFEKNFFVHFTIYILHLFISSIQFNK